MLVLGCAAASAEPAEDTVCGSVDATVGPVCTVYEDHCAGFMADPEGFDRSAIEPIPVGSRGRFRSNRLRGDVLGYARTEHENTLVLYFLNERQGQPTCDLLISDVSYRQAAGLYHAWRSGEGGAFAATSSLEPRAHRRDDRAFAAVFPARERSDGRVTEIAFNWGLEARRLVRPTISYQPLRDHTRKLPDRSD